MKFKDKIVVITGAAQGIGKEIAEEFAREKAIVNLFDLNEVQLQKTAKELQTYTTAVGYSLNVVKSDEVEKNINKVIDNFRRVDILINNAGITRDNLVLKLSESEWDSVISVNLKGSFNCIKSCVRPMMKQRFGRIVNISSVIGIMGNPGQANYAASKAGLIGLTKTLAKELGSRNITVNAIAPGYIDTAMTQVLDEKVKEYMMQRIPLKRFGIAKDIAKAAAFLVSDDASYINGHVLVVDGGLT